MKFHIKNKDGSEWLYDNITSKVVSLSGNLTTAEKAKEFGLEKPFVGNNSLGCKSNLIKKLRIQLGLKCNYKCSFCLQAHLASDEKMDKPEDVYLFFKKLDDSGLTIDSNAKIELWGGEPLVYIKLLKTLIPELRSRYPNAVISMISNGTLLTKSITDFLLEYRVRLTLSHDGQAYFLRGPDPLNDETILKNWLSAFERYRENNLGFGINTVISQYNADLFDIQDFFAKTLSPEVPFGFEGVVVAHAPNTVQFTHFPSRERELLRASIKRAVFLEPESKVAEALNGRLIKTLSSLAYGYDMTKSVGRCDVLNAHTIGVDLKGRLLSCHNVSGGNESTGTIENYKDQKFTCFTLWQNRPNCKNCIVLIGCKGNCPRDSLESHINSCDAQKMFHGFIFESAWTLFTGSEIDYVKETPENT